MAYKRKPNGKKRNKNAVKHGIYRANKNILHDKRTTIAKMILHVQQALTESLGGSQAISPQQKLILDRASFKAVRCVLVEKEIIHSNGDDVKASLLHDYFRWTNSLREDLKLLGLKRIPKEIQSVRDYVQETYGNEAQQ